MNPTKPLPIALAIALALAASGCSNLDAPAAETPRPSTDASASAQAGHDEDALAASSVRMGPADRDAAGVVLATLDAGDLTETLQAPGEVVDDAYGTTLVTPRVEALVVRRHARLGDDVDAGDPLVTMSSVEVARAQGALMIADQEWRRVQALGREAVSGRRYEEAEVAVQQARAAARAYGLPGTPTGRADGEFTLVAPHAGRLTEDAFVVGERIEPGRTLFRLVDESVVWVDATLPAEQARRVAVGGRADVVLGSARLAGRVVQRAHRTSEDTRTARVRIEVANEGDRLHGGDYVEVFLAAGGGSAALSVPTSALVQLDGDIVVFREDGEWLRAAPVRTGAVVGERTIIGDGLATGDRIVVEGAYALKARLLKAQMGEGHGH